MSNYYECETCSESFYNKWDCHNHMDEYDHWPQCETCDRTFRTRRACNQHMDALDHWAPRYDCETCSRDFASPHAAKQHMDALGHWAPRVPCETCDQKFRTVHDAEQHMKAKGHYSNYCKSCDRKFNSPNSLQMHLNSKAHRKTMLPCPFCKRSYVTASGLSHHLESGSCSMAPMLNRETIHRMIRERDPHSVITMKQIEWVQETVQYTSTGQAFNGHAWECYLCHRQFNTDRSLNSHLNSPTHKQKVYHCPNARGRCVRKFVSLAGLFNHLESESCSFMRFEKVQEQVGHIIQGDRLIAF
ncbi:hypothetical protein VTO42DRAFT_1837 [Malbranchea cinnamomea]